MPDQPTSKLTSLGLARTAKLKVEAGTALMCAYPSAKEWVCATKPCVIGLLCGGVCKANAYSFLAVQSDCGDNTFTVY